MPLRRPRVVVGGWRCRSITIDWLACLSVFVGSGANCPEVPGYPHLWGIDLQQYDIPLNESISEGLIYFRACGSVQPIGRSGLCNGSSVCYCSAAQGYCQSFGDANLPVRAQASVNSVVLYYLAGNGTYTATVTVSCDRSVNATFSTQWTTGDLHPTLAGRSQYACR
jgi:hypothetical protein